MQTKIVYTMISNKDDYFSEQFLASAWSARHYNSDAKIILLCDKATAQYIDSVYYNDLFGVLDEIIKVDVPDELSNKEKSRWIKTKAREYVSGSMIQLDVDTIICGDLSELDKMNVDVAAVYDYHCKFNDAPYKQRVINSVSKYYGVSKDAIMESKTDYYNSGVIYSSDTVNAKSFYNDWHYHWQKGLASGVSRDQYAFFRASMNNTVEELSGDYNCMIRSSIAFLYTARIMHFFNSGWGSDLISPFFSGEIYRSIKNNKGLSDADKKFILVCKSEFESPSVIMDSHEAEIIFSPVFILLRVWHKEKSVMFRCANLLARVILKLKGL